MAQHFRRTSRTFVSGAILGLLGAALLSLGGAPLARAQAPVPVAGDETSPPPDQMQVLLELFGDPQVQDRRREQLSMPMAFSSPFPP
jgi:hypothetical protein